MQNSSVLLVQADEGVSVLVVDRIGDFYRNLPRRADVIVTTVGARHKCQQDFTFWHETSAIPFETVQRERLTSFARDLRLAVRLLNSTQQASTPPEPPPGYQLKRTTVADRQSGPRPDSRHLRQPALEGLTNSAWTETPQRGGRNKSGEGAAATALGGGRRRREAWRGGGGRIQVEARVFLV
ncbi:serine/threonine protein kinase [Dorcoceras hygrometricum]|uniref:Serine/threonine protein kinase n=1 Tax=Dorcoceras hygrometricum TaxID=472368 RepID=A0A2Z7CUV4_9LAMI|nr:serine/threonine protein kinase [Dorcoceras hygrometricum]